MTVRAEFATWREFLEDGGGELINQALEDAGSAWRIGAHTDDFGCTALVPIRLKIPPAADRAPSEPGAE